jgi:hypothetical protein
VRAPRLVPPILVFALGLQLALAGPAAAAVTPVKVVGGPGNQFNPFSDGTSIVWASNAGHPKRYDALARSLSGGGVQRLNLRRTEGFAGGIDPIGPRAIIQQVRNGLSDIVFVNLDNGNRSAPPGVNSRKWEWAPRISATYILFARSVRRNGVWFDDVLLTDRGSGKAVRLASYRYSKNALLAISNVGDRYATWARCAATCSAYLYDTQTSSLRKIPTKNGRPQYGATVDEANGQLYFFRSGAKCGVDVNMWRVPVATPGGSLTRIVAFPDGVDTGWTLDLAPGTGGVDAYFQRWNCATRSGDIYRAPSVDAV